MALRHDFKTVSNDSGFWAGKSKGSIPRWGFRCVLRWDKDKNSFGFQVLDLFCYAYISISSRLFLSSPLYFLNSFSVLLEVYRVWLKNLNWRHGSFLLNSSGDLISPVIMIIASIYMCKWRSSLKAAVFNLKSKVWGWDHALLWYNKFCAHQHILPGEEVKILIKFSWPSHFQPPSLHQLLFRLSPYHRTFVSPYLEHSVFPEILLMTQTWFCKAITLQLKNKLTNKTKLGALTQASCIPALSSVLLD